MAWWWLRSSAAFLLIWAGFVLLWGCGDPGLGVFIA